MTATQVPSRPSSPLPSRRIKAGPGRAVRIVVMIAIALMFLIPIVAFLVTPARCQTSNPDVGFVCHNTLLHSSGGFLGFGDLSWNNLAYSWREVFAFSSGQFARWFLRTFIVAGGGTIVAILVGLPAGYAMARLRFRLRRPLLFVTLLTMVMPNTALVIPIFLEVNTAGLLGSIWPVIIVMGFFPFGVYLAYIHYSTTLPRELIDAARVDGLSETSIFTRVALPLARDAIALIVFFSFVANWTNYFLPLVLFPNTDNSTLPVGLQNMIQNSQEYTPVAGGLRDAAGNQLQLYLPQLSLAAILTVLPILALFIVAQRYLVRGQTVGAVKT